MQTLVLILMLAALPAHAGTSQIFPPMGCDSDSIMLSWTRGDDATRCRTPQDVLSLALPACQDNQYIAKDTSGYVCRTITTPPACADGELLTYDGTQYACRHLDVPSCASGEVLTFNGTAYACVAKTDDIPTCTSGQFLTYNGSYQCVAVETPKIPSCAAYEVLTADGQALSCASRDSRPIIVTSAPAGWYRHSNGAYYSDATAGCPTGHVASGGGGYCDAAGGPGVSLFSARPSGANAFTASCFGAGGVDPAGGGAIAYVYCMSIP